MVSKQLDFDVFLNSDRKRILVQLGSKTHSLSLARAFSFANELLCQKKYEEAVQVCDALVESGSLGARAVIMLAFCKAQLNDYSSCNEVLRTLFAQDDPSTAEALHTAFVYSHLGMWADAIGELAKVAHDHPNLPSTCLLLGDLFAALGHKDKALQCWRLAIQRDQPEGAVAQAAEKEVATMLQRMQLQRHNGASVN